MQDVFRGSPTSLRQRRHRADRLAADGGLTLRLPVVPGYDWDAVRGLLAARLVPGVETVDGDTYRRTITVAGAPGLLEVCPGREDCLLLRAHLPYWEGLIHVVDRVGLLLGTEGDHPASAWNQFEAGVSAILSGRADRDRLLGALVARLGTPVPGLPGGLGYTFPDPARVTQASLAPIGFGPADASAIAALAVGGIAGLVPPGWRRAPGLPDAQPSSDIDPLKLKPAIHWKRLITVGSLGERWKRLEGGERDDVNRVLGLRSLRCRISPDADGSL
jgi:AraC family transcriptional regulator of adaptative response / DNA-3-methyladenine glycosylase II